MLLNDIEFSGEADLRAEPPVTGAENLSKVKFIQRFGAERHKD
jgi:hypothetical protein